MFTQKGASQQGFPLLSLLFVLLRGSLLLREPDRLLQPGAGAACPSAADPAKAVARSACSLPSLPRPSQASVSLCVAPRAFIPLYRVR